MQAAAKKRFGLKIGRKDRRKHGAGSNCVIIFYNACYAFFTAFIMNFMYITLFKKQYDKICISHEKESVLFNGNGMKNKKVIRKEYKKYSNTDIIKYNRVWSTATLKEYFTNLSLHSRRTVLNLFNFKINAAELEISSLNVENVILPCQNLVPTLPTVQLDLIHSIVQIWICYTSSS